MAVQYNVSGLVREPVGSTRAYEIDDNVLLDDVTPRREHVVGQTTLLRTKTGVFVTAHLSSVHHERCSRCLRAIDVPVQFDIEEEFFQMKDVETGAALQEPDEAEAFRIDARHTLDMEEAIRQSWATVEPMQPLCGPDCKGLCPRCGQDLNERTCGCQPEADARWAALRDLERALRG